MAGTTPSLKASDLLAVKSRVSWGAISAGAMVALAIYFLLTLLGVAIGLEIAARRGGENLPTGAAIYSIFALLVSMFFGGWSVSRLAVGESKLEAILYGIILWGVLFVGMIWLIGAGVKVGFGAMVSGAVVINSDDPSDVQDKGAVNALAERYNSDLGGQKFVEDLTKIGVEPDQAKKIQGTLKDRLTTLRDDPAGFTSKVGADLKTNDVKPVVDISRQAAWYSLAGVVISMAAVILGSLIGSGDMPVPVPILGVARRQPVDPRL